MLIEAFFVIAPNWKQPRPSTCKQLNCSTAVQWSTVSNEKE